jgi:hypothetical protein
MRRPILALLMILFASNAALNSPDFPAWEPIKTNYISSVVKLETENGWLGSGTVVKFVRSLENGFYEGLVITASHVTEPGEKVKVYFPNGDEHEGLVIVDKDFAWDPYNDLALVKVKVRDSVRPLDIGDPSEIPLGAMVELSGYGRCEADDLLPHQWEGEAAVAQYYDQHHRVESDALLVFDWGVQGDSGGPVVYQGKLVGVICRGDYLLEKQINGGRNVVLPVHTSNPNRLKDYIDNYKEKAPPEKVEPVECLPNGT